VASQENAASPNNVAPNNVAPHVFEMCLHNVSSASGGKVRALLPTPWNIPIFSRYLPVFFFKDTSKLEVGRIEKNDQQETYPRYGGSKLIGSCSFSFVVVRDGKTNFWVGVSIIH